MDPLDSTWKDENVLMAQTYVNNVVDCFEAMFGAELKLQKMPVSDQYQPEIDKTPLLDSRGAALYPGLIGSTN